MRYVPILFALACGGQELEIRVSDLEVTVSMLSEGGADRPRSGDVFAEVDCSSEPAPFDATLTTPGVADALRLRAMVAPLNDPPEVYGWREVDLGITKNGELLLSCSDAADRIRIIYL